MGHNMPVNLTRKIYVGNVPLGGDAPVVVQSMTNTDTRNVDNTLEQIIKLATLGCEIIRIAIPDKAAINALRKIIAMSPIPVIADIHFDWNLAVQAIEAGAHGIRINPGNIGSNRRVERIIAAARQNNCVIRIGVNSGSIQKNLLDKYGRPTPEAMVESALEYKNFFEKNNFENIKFSLKSSNVTDTIKAYRIMRSKCDYPLHLGITEAGNLLRGAVKSAIGIGTLLAEGIGETIRVSLTDNPEKEITVAWEILRSLNIRYYGPEIISCPTCGRTEIDIFGLVSAIEKMVAGCPHPIKIAVMGCVVNGPGEAKEADIGIAGGKENGIIFKKGKVVKVVNGIQAMLEEFSLEFKEILEDFENRLI